MGQPSPASSPRRWIGLDGLRGLAAVAVLVLHVSMYSNPSRPPGSLSDAVFRAGHLGVTLFFVLSGFLLFAPWAQGRRVELRGYALRRLARVLPAYWFALAGAALLLAGTGSSHALVPAHLPVLLTAQQGLVLDGPAELIPPAWTLGIEITFYAALPLLGLALARRPLAGSLTLFAGSIAFNAWANRSGLDPQWHSTLVGVAYAFAAGMAAATVAGRSRPALALLGGALVIANAALHDPVGWRVLNDLRDAPAAVGFALMILGLADSRLLGTAPLRWLGDRSFGLYLWHFPIISALAVRGIVHGFLGLLAIVLPLSLLAGHVSWTTVERPMIDRARGRRRTRRAPRPAFVPHMVARVPPVA